MVLDDVGWIVGFLAGLAGANLTCFSREIRVFPPPSLKASETCSLSTGRRRQPAPTVRRRGKDTNHPAKAGKIRASFVRFAPAFDFYLSFLRLPITLNSVLRFISRPAGLSVPSLFLFGAMGCLLPYPLATNRFGDMPRVTR